MSGQGDFLAGTTVHCGLTTYGYSGPQTLVGGSVVAYRDAETTPITAGITLSVNFAGIVGFNLVTVDTTGYQTAKSYHLVLATGTVDGESRAGALIDSFTLELTSALRPSSIADIATAVWLSGTRTLTSFGTLVADVWSYSTRTLTDFGVLVTDAAAAVWDALASAYNTAGTMGALLHDASQVSDPWATQLPGSYDDGTAGHILGTLNAAEITIVSPLLEGSVLQLVAGDAYDIDHGRALDDWALAGQPSLVDATVVLVIDEAVTVEAISVAGAGSSSQVPTFELTAEQTGALTRFGEKAYRYQIQATWAADAPEQPAVLAHGDVTVIERAA